MSITIKAVYENGVLKLAHPLPLAEHTSVQVTVVQTPAVAGGDRLDVGRWFAAIESEAGLIDAPEDWAARHDDYLNGASEGHGPDGD